MELRTAHSRADRGQPDVAVGARRRAEIPNQRHPPMAESVLPNGRVHPTAGGTTTYPWSQHAHTEKPALHWLDFGGSGPVLHGPGIGRTAIGSESTADPPKNRHEGYRRGPGGNWTMPSGAFPPKGRWERCGQQTPEARLWPHDRSFGGRELRWPPKGEADKHTQVAPLGFGRHISLNEDHLFPDHQWTLPVAICRNRLRTHGGARNLRVRSGARRERQRGVSSLLSVVRTGSHSVGTRPEHSSSSPPQSLSARMEIEGSCPRACLASPGALIT